MDRNKVIRRLLLAASLSAALPAVADELSQSHLKVVTYDLRSAGLDRLPDGLPPSLVVGFRLSENDRFLADLERAPAAEVKRWIAQRAKDLTSFDASRYPSDLRGDVERLVRAQRELLAKAAALPDEEAKKLYVETFKKWNAELRGEALRAQLRDEIPMMILFTDRLFDGVGEKKLKDPWLDLDTLESAARAASGTNLQVDALIAAIDAKLLTEEDLRAIARERRVPTGSGSTYAEQVKNGLLAVKKRNEARLATLRETYRARAKAIASAPVTPSIEPAGPPTMGPKWTSVRAMAAGEGAGFVRGPLNLYGRAYGPQNLGTIVDFGMRAGAFYENSALTQFELAESFRRQREYQERLRDWERNGRKDWERYQEEKWRREMDAKQRDFRIRLLLGLPTYGPLGAAIPAGDRGLNVPRFSDTSGAAVVNANPTADAAAGAGMQRL